MTYNSDGSSTNIQTLHDGAADGDTITIPAGTFAWTTVITITKAITLQGAGKGVTFISSSAAGGQSVAISCVAGKTTTIRDFSVGAQSATNCFFLVNGAGTRQFRFTNLAFSANSFWSIWISSPGATNTGVGPYGLIDHCDWTGGRSGVYVRDNPLATTISWDRDMTWGTEQAVYMEDCTFTVVSNFPNFNVAMDGDNGARIVFRHNTLQDYFIGTHGADSPGPVNSALQHEIMHNTYTATDGVGFAFAFLLRGGTAAVFDNTLNAVGSGAYNHFLQMEFYRAIIGGGGVCVQDRFYPADYWGTMQPGGGHVASAGQDPNWPSKNWGSVPVYYWGNHINAPITFSEIGAGIGDDEPFMQLNRDYFNGVTKPGYTELAYPHPMIVTGDCVVPNFIGRKINVATSVWVAAGFSAENITVVGRPTAKIISQTIPAGTSAACTSETITVAEAGGHHSNPKIIIVRPPKKSNI